MHKDIIQVQMGHMGSGVFGIGVGLRPSRLD